MYNYFYSAPIIKPLRVGYAGPTYHVTSRGDRREAIEEKESLDDLPAVQKRAHAKPINYYQDRYPDSNEAIRQAF